LAIPDVEVKGACVLPAEILVGVKELFDMPAFGVLFDKEAGLFLLAGG
jgi:hypothetical protein